jgi:hypothetical protein
MLQTAVRAGYSGDATRTTHRSPRPGEPFKRRAQAPAWGELPACRQRYDTARPCANGGQAIEFVGVTSFGWGVARHNGSQRKARKSMKTW